MSQSEIMSSPAPLSILLVAPQPFFQERGTPIAVRLLAQTLAEEGYAVHLLVYHEGEDIKLPGVQIHRSAKLSFISDIRPGMSLKKIVCDFFMLFKMISLSRQYSFDLVHAGEESVFLAQFLKIFTRTPYLYDMDSCMSEQIIDKYPGLKWLGKGLETFERRAIQKSMGVIAVCRALEDMARGYAPDKAILRLEDISMVDEDVVGDESLREKYDVTGVMLLYVGNLESYQGIDLMLEGFAQAQSEAEADALDASLMIIGGNADDIASCTAHANQLGIADKVVFCGPRSMDLLGYYLAQADILVSPRSQGNNTPMKIYSYLGSGKTVLATRLPTHTQALNDEVACLVEPNAVAMGAGIRALCSDEKLRKQLGERGKALADKEYSLSAFKRKLSAFYKEIAPGKAQ